MSFSKRSRSTERACRALHSCLRPRCRKQRMNRFFLPAMLVCSIGLSGCVTATVDTTAQQVEVHAILDHREVAGVGCLLANDFGRWFVVAPGRVTVVRSSKPLAVYCK